jgi:Mpv17 / PMP22 family
MTKLQILLSALMLLACSSEAFSRDFARPTVHLPPQRIPTTRLEQASVAVPVDVYNNDDDNRPNVFQRVAESLPRGGTTTEGSFLQRHPFVSAFSITTVNAVLADLLTQLVFEGNPWNPKRSLVFGAFGLLYQGMVQYAIVNLFWEKLFPGNSRKAVVSKICGMNLLADPLFFMPTFYIFKEVMATGSLGMATVKAALLGYKANCLLDWRNSWMVWFPGHAVTYGVMPSHKRIPWMAFLSFFYMCVLSITRGGA